MPTETKQTTRASANANAVFHAVSDPNRRRILETLRGGERSAGEIVDEFDVTFAAISQHLKVLLEAGLVERRSEGRQRFYTMHPHALKTVHDWTEGFRDFWEGRIDRLAGLLDDEP